MSLSKKELFKEIKGKPFVRGPRLMRRLLPNLKGETAWSMAVFVTQGLPILISLFGFYLAFQIGIGAMEITVFLVMHFLAAIGLEIGLHRYFSHKAFKAGEKMSIFLAILGSSVSLGPVSYWALLHREHHQNSDTEKDPHSPQDVYQEGSGGLVSRLLYAHMGWNYHQRAMRISPTINFHKYHQLTNDLHSHTGSAKLASICNLYNLWVALGILLPAIVGGLWVGSWMGFLQGALWGGFIRIFVGQHTVWAVNSLAHTIGYRPFKTRDSSKNSPYFVLVLTATMGIIIYLCSPEGSKALYTAIFLPLFFLISIPASWHNNHHAFPSAATQQFSWWHFDSLGWVILLWEKLGLVHKVNRPSAEQIKKARIS
jgi:stearoyl-CoA desaturase (delta-9 desaturase)